MTTQPVFKTEDVHTLITDFQWEMLEPTERRAFVVRTLKDAARSLDRGIRLRWGPSIWKVVESVIGKTTPVEPEEDTW